MIKESKIQMILKRTNILTNYAACSYGNKVVCVNDKFSNPFKSYLGEDAAYNFIDSILEESKYCSDMIKKHFNQKLVITKKDDKDSQSAFKYQICDNVYVDGDVIVKDHCHIAEKYRGSVHRDCSVKVKLNHNFTIVFHNLKNYDSHFIMEDIGKSDFKINDIPNRSENI